MKSAFSERAAILPGAMPKKRGLFEAVCNNATVAIFLMDDRQHCVYMNPAAEQLTGYTLAETKGRTLHEVVHHTRPDGRPYPIAECPIDRAFPQNNREQGEEIFVHKDGGFYPVAYTASPIREEGVVVGTIIEVRGIRDEIARQHALEEQARHLEVLNRTGAMLAAKLDLQEIVQAVTDAATKLSEAQFGAFFYNVVSDSGECYQLYVLSGAPREAFSHFPMPRNTAVFGPTFRGEGVVRSGDITKDPRYGHNPPYKGMPKGHLPVRSYMAVPVIGRSGEVLGGLFLGHERKNMFTARAESIVTGVAAQAAIAIDNARLFQAVQTELVERRRAEERQRLLIHELNHRVKNTLATVQSIATQTLTSAGSDEEARKTFVARLIALSNAHSLLTRENWEGVGLRDLALSALRAFGADSGGRLEIDGEDVWLPPNVALSFTMALHELATNATKYGALSSDKGRVFLSWSSEARPEGRWLNLSWREQSGPPVSPPKRTGFGSRLIQRGLAREVGGMARLEFLPAGVECMVQLPLTAQSK